MKKMKKACELIEEIVNNKYLELFEVTKNKKKHKTLK